MDLEDVLEDTVLVSLRINGELHELEVPAHRSLLDLLREDLHLTGAHMGCMTGHCGACTVSIDGKVAKSCVTLAATLPRAKITTIEGLDPDGDHRVQQAWRELNVPQCGFCQTG
ncbi:MAG: 2Fe-2S iron-sulfur cluster-binding protein, partial [Pseudomonadota bacterium]